MNPDLLRERTNPGFSNSRMAVILFGKHRIEKSNKMRKILVANPSFDGRDLWWMGGTDRYFRACKQAEEFVRLARQYGWVDDPEYMDLLLIMTGEDFFLHVHIAMFIPSIQKFADDDQKRDWLPSATNFTVLGTYAQTELGHGSNVPAIETTADFDVDTDEWVLNTPSITATKWWVGGLAKSCTHCVLMARVRIRGKDYGIHPFMLQLRDMNNHQSLKGIVLNHLGQKYGYNGMDNGTMQLQHVRIPRRHLFMRFCSVDRQGNYTRRGDQKLMWATMTFTRKQIIMNAGAQLLRACIVATRYSAVRRQFVDSSEDIAGKDITDISKLPESAILNYSSQQYALFPLIATSIAYWFTSVVLNKKYEDIMDECNRSDFSRLSDIHALTSALKGTMTYTVLDGIEACRKACGGHGFALSAGIPLFLTNYAPQATYEGDFVVLCIQAGRILLKSVEQKMKGQLPDRLAELSTKYLFEFDPFQDNTETAGKVDFHCINWLLHAYKQRSCVLTFKTAQAFASSLAEGKNQLNALDDIKIDLMRVTTAYANVVILESFNGILSQQLQGDAAAEVAVLTKLRTLFALHWMEQKFGEFVVSGVVCAEHYDPLMQNIKALLKEIRPHAVNLVDSVGMPDYLLNSALGRYDGRVYEALLQSTQYEPLNRHDVTDGYYQSLQYILHPDRRQASKL